VAQPFLILDGYNVMHAAGMARFLGGPGELQAAREGLLQFIAEELTEVECRRTHVVFDAINAPTHLQRVYRIRSITVEFADPGGDADTVIENLIRGHNSPRQVRVVSSDHRIQRAAKRRRCRFIDSEEWLARLEKRAARQMKANRKPMSVEEAVKFGGQLAPAEVERWMREFGVADSDENSG
jgi:predicted RNA-binding protein with PIN domain